MTIRYLSRRSSDSCRVEVPDHVHRGQWVRLRVEGPEGAWTWTWESTDPLFPLTLDGSEVGWIPETLGEVRIRVRGVHPDSRTTATEVVTVVHAFPLPHGRGHFPEVPWLQDFVRNWTQSATAQERMQRLWSGYAQVLASVLSSLYHANQEKSLLHFPLFETKRWAMLRLRVDLPPSRIVAGKERSGEEATYASPVSVYLEDTPAFATPRVLLLEDVSFTATAVIGPASWRRPDDTELHGIEVGLDRDAGEALRHLRWHLCSGALQFANDSLASLRVSSGDLLTFQWSYEGRQVPYTVRIWGVSERGDVGFEWSLEPISTAYAMMNGAKPHEGSLRHLEESLRPLDVDYGAFGFRSLIAFATQIYALLHQGDLARIEQMYGLSLRADTIHRLSRYDLPEETLEVSSLQTTIENPVFLLFPVEDFVLSRDERGAFLSLRDTVVFDESLLPYALWAEAIYLHTMRRLEQKFGKPLGLMISDGPFATVEAYKNALLARLSLFVEGMTPERVEKAVHLLLQLPVTPAVSTTVLYLLSERRCLVSKDIDGDVYLLRWPEGLALRQVDGLDVAIGTLLLPFTPLCTGVRVTDRVRDPAWWASLQSQAVITPYGDTFHEIQKQHTFEVSVHASLLTKDVLSFLSATLRDLPYGFRLPTLLPLLMGEMPLEDDAKAASEVQIEQTTQWVDSPMGFEGAFVANGIGSHGFRTSPTLSMFRSTPSRGYRRGGLVAPRVGATTFATGGYVRLEVDEHLSTFALGEVITESGSGASGVVVARAANSGGGPHTCSLLVQDTGGGIAFPVGETVVGGLGAEGNIIGESFAALQTDVDWMPNGFPILRYLDRLYIETSTGKEWFWVWGVCPEDSTQLIFFPMEGTDILGVSPLPYGESAPGGTSSYRPPGLQDRDDWIAENGDCRYLVERIVANPLFSSEMHHQPEMRLVSVGQVGNRHECTFAPLTLEGLRAGLRFRIQDPLSSVHGEEGEIIREVDGNGEISDLADWEAGTGFSVVADGLTLADEGEAEIFDPRLPTCILLSGTLPSQAGRSDDFSVVFPPAASGSNGAYVGMWFRARSGSGAYSPAQKGSWRIMAYNGTTKEATLWRNHRVVFDATTEFEVLSRKETDMDVDYDAMALVSPTSIERLFFLAPLKDGEGTCVVDTTAGSPTIIATDSHLMRPSGKDFVTANTGGDAPFALGAVGVGDLLVLHAVDAGDVPLSTIVYTVVGNILADRVDVSPAPLATTIAGMYFTVFRSNETRLYHDGVSYVAGTYDHSPIADWETIE